MEPPGSWPLTTDEPGAQDFKVLDSPTIIEGTKPLVKAHEQDVSCEIQEIIKPNKKEDVSPASRLPLEVIEQYVAAWSSIPLSTYPK